MFGFIDLYSLWFVECFLFFSPRFHQYFDMLYQVLILHIWHSFAHHPYAGNFIELSRCLAFGCVSSLCTSDLWTAYEEHTNFHTKLQRRSRRSQSHITSVASGWWLMHGGPWQEHSDHGHSARTGGWCHWNFGGLLIFLDCPSPGTKNYVYYYV